MSCRCHACTCEGCLQCDDTEPYEYGPEEPAWMSEPEPVDS